MVATLTAPVERIAAEPATVTLSGVHDQWITRMSRLLAPALSPRATFWERWSAARFLADQFEDRFRLECGLAESLDPVLGPAARARLTRARVALERARAELLGAARRRGTGLQVALLARRFLDCARQWCASLELATMELPVDRLPHRGRRLLEHLRVAAGLDL